MRSKISFGRMLSSPTVTIVRYIALSITLFAAVPGTSNAEVTLFKQEPRQWVLSGAISPSDVKAVAELVESSAREKQWLILNLNTPGGDVASAIEIGRLLRGARALAYTYNEGKCYSSCIFVLVGATKRVLAKSIGIHRPYSTNTSELDFQTRQAQARRTEKLAKEYLAEMNVSPSLYDDMVAIPPEKLKMLTSADLQRYGILEVDPVEQEMDDAIEARRYGINKETLIARKARIELVCQLQYVQGTRNGDFIPYANCREAVLSGKK